MSTTMGSGAEVTLFKEADVVEAEIVDDNNEVVEPGSPGTALERMPDRNLEQQAFAAEVKKTQTKKRRAGEENRDPKTEKWLNDNGVTWEYRPAVPLTEINQRRSLQNQARFNQLISQTVEDYTEDYVNGDIFPPIVVHNLDGRGGNLEGPDSKIAVDGNHRWKSALNAMRTTHDMYVITDGNPDAIAVMAMEANSKHGQNTTHEEKVQHAVHAVIRYKLSVAEASRRMGAKKTDVEAAVRRQNARQRADQVGILRSDWDSLNTTTKTYLGTISTDEGFAAATKLTKKAGLRAEEVKELVQQLNMTRSGRKQEELCRQIQDALRDRIKGTGGGTFVTDSKKPNPPRVQVMTSVVRLNSSMPDGMSLRDLARQFSPAERPKKAEEFKQTAERLLELAKEMEAL